MAEGGEPPELFPPSKRTKSAVWEYFGYRKKPDGHGLEEEGRPMCKTCLRTVAAQGGNTSNMIMYDVCIYGSTVDDVYATTSWEDGPANHYMHLSCYISISSSCLTLTHQWMGQLHSVLAL